MSEPRFDSLYSAWATIAGGTGYDSTYSAMKAALEKVTGQENYDSVYSIAADLADDVESGSASVAKNTQLNEEITENGTYTFTPDEGYVYDSVTVSVDAGSKAEGTIKIVNNGTYDVTSYAQANVAVGGESKPQIPNGFKFTGGDMALVDFGAYDWSMVYDMFYFFNKCTHSTSDWSNFEENFNGEILYGVSMFKDYQGSTVPYINTSGVTMMSNMFGGCGNLTTIPQLDTSNVTTMSYMFDGCASLTTIPQLDTSNVTSIVYMFQDCASLTTIPQLDTSNVVSVEGVFKGCASLTTIPQLDTSNVTSMYSMFKGCASLTTIPQIDTSKVTDFAQMFRGCKSLTSAPDLDYSNITGGTNNDVSGVAYMFTGSGVKSIPDVNSKKVSAFGGYYSWTYSAMDLQSIGVVDCDSVTSVSGLLGNTLTSLSKLTNLGGFRNLGKANSVADTNGQYFLNNAPILTYESVMNVLNLLYDRASAGLSVLTLKLHPNHLAMLSEDDIAVATNKGWNLV